MTDTIKVIELIPFQDSGIVGASFNQFTKRVCIEMHKADDVYLYPNDIKAINKVVFPENKPTLAQLVKQISEADVELDDEQFNAPMREILDILGCSNNVEYAVSFFEGHTDKWLTYSVPNRRHLLTGFIRNQINKQITELMR